MAKFRDAFFTATLIIVSCLFFDKLNTATANPKVNITKVDCNKRVYDYDRNRDVAVELAREVARCGGPIQPGEIGFNSFWDGIARKCQAGEELDAIHARLWRSERWMGMGFVRPDCKVVERIVSLYGVETNAINISQGPEIAKKKLDDVIAALRAQAIQGSQQAKLMLASKLLYIEDYTDMSIPDSREGIKLLGELAADGFRDQVFNLVSDLEKRYPDPRRLSHRQRVFLPIYRHLAEAGDSRAWVILAGSRVMRAEYEMRSGGLPAAQPYIESAREQLSKAKSFANPQLSAEIIKVENSLNALEARNISIGQVITSIGLLAIFASQFVEPAPPPKYTGVPLQSNCAGVKDAVRWDPSLAAAYAIGGCAPY